MSITANSATCPLCSNEDTRLLFDSSDKLLKMSEDVFSVFQCSDCGTSFISPLISSEDMVKYYDNYYPDNSQIKSLHLQQNIKTKLVSRPIMYFQNINPLLKLIKNYTKNGKLLEIGCGTGKFLYPAQKSGLECYGIELSASASLFCNESLHLNVKNESIEQAFFPESFFDVIILSHVFEHLRNPHDIIERIKKWLKEDGVIIITVPNGDSLQRIKFQSLWYGYDIPRHYYTFSQKSFFYIAEKYRLNINFMGTIYGTYSGFLTSLLIAQKEKKEHFLLNIISPLFNSQIMTMLMMPFCFVIDRLGMGEALTVVFKKNKNYG